MRVLFVSDVYFPRVNGVSTSIRTFRQDLRSRGIEALLVAPAYESGAGPEADDADIIRVPSSGIPGDPEDRRMNWGALKAALADPKLRPDVIHIHTPFIAHYAGTQLARSAKIPCVATYHTFLEEYLHHYVPILPRPIGRMLARKFTRSQCDDVQALIAPSDPMRDVLTAYGVRTPIHVLPTGLAADRFVPGDGARFRASAALPPDRPIVMYVGRVAYEKNIHFLIEVFARLRQEIPRALFVIAGEGPARESLRQMVTRLGLVDDVHFAGYLDRDTALLDCYAAADVFVFASRTETQGLVLLEAMAQGAPIVSTAELGTRSILRPECGAIVVQEDLAAFTCAAVRVLQDPGLRARLAEQGRTYARTWSSTVMAGRLAELYDSVRQAQSERAVA